MLQMNQQVLQENLKKRSRKSNVRMPGVLKSSEVRDVKAYVQCLLEAILKTSTNEPLHSDRAHRGRLGGQEPETFRTFWPVFVNLQRVMKRPGTGVSCPIMQVKCKYSKTSL